MGGTLGHGDESDRHAPTLVSFFDPNVYARRVRALEEAGQKEPVGSTAHAASLRFGASVTGVAAGGMHMGVLVCPAPASSATGSATTRSRSRKVLDMMFSDGTDGSAAADTPEATRRLLWMWGHGAQGQLGLGHCEDALSPQVGGLMFLHVVRWRVVGAGAMQQRGAQSQRHYSSPLCASPSRNMRVCETFGLSILQCGSRARCCSWWRRSRTRTFGKLHAVLHTQPRSWMWLRVQCKVWLFGGASIPGEQAFRARGQQMLLMSTCHVTSTLQSEDTTPTSRNRSLRGAMPCVYGAHCADD